MTQEEILNKKFRRSFCGYDMQEVDAFLDEIIEDHKQRQQELDMMMVRIEALLERLDQLEGNTL